MTSSMSRRLPIVVLATLFVHDAVLRGLRIDGVRPDLLLGLVVVTAIIGGPERGAVCGFLAGMVADLFLPTPLGMSALVWCVLGYALGTLQTTMLPHSRIGVLVTTTVASAAGEVAFAVVGYMLGQAGMLTGHLFAVIVVVSLVNAAASWPLARAARWAIATRTPDGSFAK